MRSARLVGLSPDGRSLIVTTDVGEELAIDADARLRAAVRGDQPRRGRLEFEMETALSPRDIQTRIRSGATLDEVARVAGIEMERVERFAAPVLAERDYVATTAMSSSVRRRGETSGHRNLRITVTERLLGRGIDIDTIDWDAFRLEDGRWTVSADFRSGESERHAEFTYDPRGRFSIAANDEARWLLGEQSAAKGPQSAHPRPEQGGDDGGEADRRSGEDADAEPTVDLNDELALVRATQERPQPGAESGSAPPVAYFEQSNEASEPTIAVVRPLRPVADLPPEAAEEPAGGKPAAAGPAAESSSDPGQESAAELDPAEATVEQPAEEPTDEEPTAEELTDEEPVAAESGLGALDQMLGGEGYAKEQAEPIYAGLSDASAVPETDGVGWEPANEVNYPVEPSQVYPVEPSEEDAVPAERPIREADGPRTPAPVGADAGSTEEEQEFELQAGEPPARKPVKRKRASVPSWDEIMFGGPRPPG